MPNHPTNIDGTHPVKANLRLNENSLGGIHCGDMAEVDSLASLLRVTVLKAWKAKRENIMRNGDWTAMPQLFSEFLQFQECRLHMCVARMTFRLGLHTIARQSSETALFMLQDFASITK
jgi:hypothetical protein